jgi:beta-lactamase regulating signal transducer with metallopeptidase domain
MNDSATAGAFWLLHTAAGGGLLLLVTWGLMACTRQPALRQRLGEFGLLAALTVVLLSLGPRWLLIPWPQELGHRAQDSSRLDTTVPTITPQRRDDTTVEATTVTPAATAVAEDESISRNEPPFTAEFLHDLACGAVLSYVVGAGLLFGRWLLGYLALIRLLRSATPAPEALVALFAQVAGRAQPPRLLVSTRLRVPVSCGVLKPTVVLPAALCESTNTTRLRWAFTHELTHLDRRDAWSCLLFALGQIAFFYLPWFWPVRWQVRLCQEFVADAAAAHRGSVADYAEFLLSLTGAPAVPLGATGVSGHSSDLFRRVTMLLQDPLHVETRCPRRRLLTALVGLLSLAVVLAGIGVRAEAQSTIIIITGEAAAAKEPVKDQTIRLWDVNSSKESKQIDKIILNAWNQKPATRADVAHVWHHFLGHDAGCASCHTTQVTTQHANVTNVQLPQTAVDSLRKAADRLRQNPGKTELEQIRKEIEHVIDSLQSRGAPLHRAAVRALAFSPDGSKLVVDLKPAKEAPPRLGVQVEKPSPLITEQLGLAPGEGLVIVQVIQGTAAEKAGLKANDILLEIHGKTVPSEPEEFTKQVAALKPGMGSAIILRKGKREEIKGLTLAAAQVGFRISALRDLSSVRTQQPPPDSGAVTTTRNRNVEQFTTRYRQGKLTITVTGTMDTVKSRVSEIVIQEGDAAPTKYGSVEDVPASYRDRVRQLLEAGRENQSRGDTDPLRGEIELELRTP